MRSIESSQSANPRAQRSQWKSRTQATDKRRPPSVLRSRKAPRPWRAPSRFRDGRVKGAGTIVTSPNGTGGSTRNVTRRAPMTVSTEISVRLNAPLLFKFHHSRLWNFRPRNGRLFRTIHRRRKVQSSPNRHPGLLRGFALRNDEDYFSGCPMVTVSLPTPSTSHSILSPATVAATPEGVPVMMMSPAASSTISESFEMISGTFQII